MINTAQVQAEQSLLLIFGVLLISPNTGYGYIQADEKSAVSKVNAFVEKPDLASVAQYVACGNYYWNSGTFMFKASTLISVHRFPCKCTSTDPSTG
nr:hypothetical protein [Rhodospirillales bacterium]